jgi:hypothetical protein
VDRYRYDDGTEQPEPNEFYDAEEHTSCRPLRWTDGVVRCIPVADAAMYVDQTCTDLVGRGTTITHPTHFIGFDRNRGRLAPARIYRAGAETAEVTQFYEKQDGVCNGAITDPAIKYYAIGRELDASELVAIRDTELGEGAVGLRIRETDDGLVDAFGLHDRDLDVECAPERNPGSAAHCEPIGAAPASVFRDSSCDEPAILVDVRNLVPAIAAVADSAGCTSYHRVGGEVSDALYRRDGVTCVATVRSPTQRVFAVDAPIELPLLGRTLEEVPGRRLQRMILSEGDLRFADDLLFDTAIRAECQRRVVDGVTRCIPAAIATATTLFTAGCVIEVRVAELPQRTCERPAFALATADDGMIDIHAIGDPVSGTLFESVDGGCQPYIGAPGAVLRALGPQLDPRTFVGAQYFGER